MKSLLNTSLAAAACAALLSLPAAADQPAPNLAAGYNGFGFALIHQLETSGGNTIISPLSVATALAMTANGAASSTRSVMLNVLGAGHSDAPAFNAANAALVAALRNGNGDVKFSIANALWLNPKAPPLPAFVELTHASFDATAKDVPFGDPSAAETINAWVKANTDGLIPSIIDSTSPSDLMVLTNALALEAKWETPFEKNDTHEAPFTLASGEKTTVSMMAHTGQYSYTENDTWQMARLPYRGDRYAMYVLLPKSGVKLATAFAALDEPALAAALKGLKPAELAFAMPRFTAEYRAALREPLSHLGMGIAFSGGADFSNMVAPPQRAAISEVEHRTFVQVDEEGTKAAAATAVTMKLLAIRVPQNVITMTVDRPFAFAIRDDQTGQLLFLGTVYQPK